MLNDAIETFHALLTPAVARESWEQLQDQIKRRGLYFGERDIVTVLRPRLLTAEQYHLMQRAIRSIMPAFDRVYRTALADDDFLQQFHLNDWERELIRTDPGYRDPSPSSRMDSFYLPAENRLQFTEYNAEIPAGQAYCDVLTEIFLGLRIVGEFEQQYELRPLPTRGQMLHALLDAYRQWGGTARPNIVILDWREVPTYSEFVLFREYFQSQGYACEIADPREMDYRGNKLYAGSFPVDIVYKRVLTSELVERGELGLRHPVVRAVRDRAVCMVNPFHCKVLHKKASLAVLTDERNAYLFAADELRAINEYIPWSRVLAERHTIYNGEKVDLIPFLVTHKDDFVLKPNDEYGGKGVTLGWTVTPSEWETALLHGLREPTIVQRRVILPSEPYPSYVDGNVKIFDRMLDTDPYIWYGQYMSGSLCRLSTAALLNVTAGGGSTVPTFIIEKRT